MEARTRWESVLELETIFACQDVSQGRVGSYKISIKVEQSSVEIVLQKYIPSHTTDVWNEVVRSDRVRGGITDEKS